jgi:hypothetical protein
MRRAAGSGPAGPVLALLALLTAGGAAGCAGGQPLALADDAGFARLDRAAIVLLTVTASNEYRPEYELEPSHILIDSAARTGREITTFRLQESQRVGSGDRRTYLVALELPSGRYRLREILGSSGRFPIQGRFVVAVYLPFTVERSTVAYLGRVEVTLRERKDPREFPSGPPVPLIDQAMTGIAAGTFEVRVADWHDEDLTAFRARFPALRGHAVQKAILPAWAQPGLEEID